ncbi:MAG TPA: PAS domain S-box protein, partial [Desulfosalsimonadaceae bacterium]|nr:PAS domain S-box protein [Desulfosalsimonadaceae bacterium]
SRDELLRMTLMDIDTDEYGGLAADRIQQIEEKGRVVFETAHRCRDGSAIPVEVSSRKVDFEGKPCILGVARDISERLEREFEYAQILNTSIDGFWVLDDEGALLEVNPAAAEMLGCSREEMLGRNISEIDANESPEKTRQHVRALREIGYERFETRHRHKSGRLVDVEISTSYIPRSRGQYVAFIRDITERKNAEEALRASEQLTRSIIDASEDIIVFKDTGSRFRVVNPAMCRMLNRSGSEIIGKTDFDLFPRQQAERFFQADRKVVETGQALMLEESVEGIEGLLWISTVKSPVVNETGEIEGIVVISRDKTEQRLAEQSLQNEKLRLSHVIEGTRAGIWDWRVQTGEIEVNERWAEIIGYRLEELAPVSRQTWKQFVHPEDLERSEALLEKHFQGELEYYECECRMRHKQGHWVWIQDRGKVTEWDRRGRPERMTGTHIDVSRQKELEQEQRSLEYRLQQSRKAESLSRMAGAIAHHFNNQLSVVSGHLELAMEDLHPEAEIRQHLNEAIKAGHRASHISSQMLAYLGQHKGRKEMLDLSEICRKHLPKLEAILAGGVSLDTDLMESGPVVYANEGELRQALTGLILNAWEAEPDFSGSVSLRTRIAAGSELEQGTTYPVDWSPSEPYYACLEVSDTGCGISPENLEKIFDPFFTTKFTGRGLGLPVVLGMARAAGGGVGVDSQVDRGTTIRVFMALAGDPCRSLPEEPAAGPENATGCTVLLVEDQEEVRTLV